MKNISCIILLVICNLCIAQTSTIGSVIDNNGEFISQVVITISKLNTQKQVDTIVISNELGNFSFKTNRIDQYVLRTSHISFKKKKKLFLMLQKQKI